MQATDTIGGRIRALRLEKGWTQLDLANAVDVTKGQVSLWESDSNAPRSRRLIHLARALDTVPTYLLHGEGDPHPLDRLPTPKGAPTEAVRLCVYLPHVTHPLVLTVQGHEMEPDLRDGDTAIVDAEDRSQAPGLYLVQIGSRTTFRRVAWVAGLPQLSLADGSREPAPLDQVVMVGRLVWKGGPA